MMVQGDTYKYRPLIVCLISYIAVEFVINDIHD